MHPPAESLRKSIHLALGVLPLAAWWLVDRWPAPTRALLVAGALLALILDAARFRMSGWRRALEALIGPVMRPRERTGLLGSTTMMLAMAIVFLLLPRTLALAAMLFLIVGDAAAAIVGRRLGRLRLAPWSTWEGAGACLVATLAVVPLVRLLDPGARPLVLVAGALAATLAESLVPGEFDNLAVPLVSGAVMGGLGGGT